MEEGQKESGMICAKMLGERTNPKLDPLEGDKREATLAPPVLFLVKFACILLGRGEVKLAAAENHPATTPPTTTLARWAGGRTKEAHSHLHGPAVVIHVRREPRNDLEPVQP